MNCIEAVKSFNAWLSLLGVCVTYYALFQCWWERRRWRLLADKEERLAEIHAEQFLLMGKLYERLSEKYPDDLEIRGVHAIFERRISQH